MNRTYDRLRFPLQLMLALMLFAVGTPSVADHQNNEPSDGSVDSFRWLKSPLPLSEVVIHDETGAPVSLTEYNGRIVLLNIWASWCNPCIRELPALDRLQARLGGDDFMVVAVSIDSDAEQARKLFEDELALKNLKFFLEPVEQLGKHFPVDVLPSNFFIDREGRAMGLLRSFVEWDASQSDDLIRRLIDGVDASTLRKEQKY